MTQEEKQLLLIDLCARLPYGVKINLHNTVFEVYFIEKEDSNNVYVGLKENDKYTSQQTNLSNVKPYLRPMSSMTEAEKIELCTRAYAPDDMKTLDEKLYVIQTNAKNAADFYNEHHLDYRCLIPMGLAIEASEGMYETNKWE